MSAEEQTTLVAQARAGDRVALTELVRQSQQPVYRLAVRMVADPTDAQDLTQEILIKIVHGLAGFRGDSAFTTWVYRVASNHLLTARRRKAEEKIESLEAMATVLADGIADGRASGDRPIEDQLMVKEAKLTCTSRMLLGLDRDHRLAFILGEILELTSDEGAEVLEIEPAAFRKRLSRARDRMAAFTTTTCGVVDAANACRCGAQAARLVRLGVFDPNNLCWTRHPAVPAASTTQVAELEGIERTLALFRSHPDYAAPEALAEAMRQLLESATSGLTR
jgi:RNA polymerase sigma factor (sigma-70 family)